MNMGRRRTENAGGRKGGQGGSAKLAEEPYVLLRDKYCSMSTVKSLGTMVLALFSCPRKGVVPFLRNSVRSQTHTHMTHVDWALSSTSSKRLVGVRLGVDGSTPQSAVSETRVQCPKGTKCRFLGRNLR